MIQKIAIQTGTHIGYITEVMAYEKDGAYRYCEELKDAILFVTVDDALRWLERTAFHNGEHRDTSYSGSPQLVRVEVEQTYTATGLVK